MERYELEDIHRESEIYKQENAYYLLEQSGELQENYLRAICEGAEIPEKIEMYSEVYDTYVWCKYSEVFDQDEKRIVEELLTLSLEDDSIDCEQFISLFDYNIIRYRDANIKANLERLTGYTDTITKALGEL